MGTHTKPLDFYKAVTARLDGAVFDGKKAHAWMAGEGLKDAQEQTSGSLTPKQTEGAFARGTSPSDSTPTGRRRELTPKQLKARGLTKKVPLLPINKQSGRLHGSFKLTKKRENPQTFELDQTDPGGGIYTLYPGGTRKMVGRGFWHLIKQRARARQAAVINHFRGRLRKP